MKIKNVKSLRHYIAANSTFSPLTINRVISALGFSLNGSYDEVKVLSAQFKKCVEEGADSGFTGFYYYNETLSFFKKNRHDIINHMEQTAAELGTDIISMVQNFGVFRNSDMPSAGQVGKALWDSRKCWKELTELYNVFAWYALEEVSRTWYRYLEENPDYMEEIAA
jgi:hypothetical protein